MSGLLSYAQKAMLLASLASSSYSAPKAPTESYLTCAVMVLAVIAYALVMTGLGLYLASQYELPIALMVTGLAILFTGLMVVLGIRYYKEARQRKVQRAISIATAEVTNTLAEVGDDISGAFKEHAGVVTIAAAMLGFLSARKVI